MEPKQMKTEGRREILKDASLGLAGLSLASCHTKSKPLAVRKKGALKQVIAAWPFMVAGEKWTPQVFIQKVIELGVEGVELFPVEHWGLLKKNGLVCAATKSHTFVRGMCQRGHHAECHLALKKAITETAQAGFPNVMTFTGMMDTSNDKQGGKVTLEQGIKNCIEGYKKIVGFAEKNNVTLILEPLNTRDARPMKGHPGYLGDRLEICMDIIRSVSSPNLKLLFDVYHLQIMEGDVIRNIKQHREVIGHVQIAGVPGRGEIGADQEVNYAAVMQTFKEIGYKGYIGHEWIPTGDPMTGLREAISICDV